MWATTLSSTQHKTHLARAQSPGSIGVPGHTTTHLRFSVSGQSTPDLYNPPVVGVPLWHPREDRA